MLLTLVFSQGLLAHAEHDKARFVANNGIDQGLCNNRFRPCKSVTYAAQQAAKGDKILVAQGQYQINTQQDLLYFSGQLVPVLAGFNQVDQYQNQNPDTFVTSLSGVPAEFAAQLSEQGFHVIRDTKSAAQISLQAKNSSFDLINLLQKSHTASHCIDGVAAGFPCENISLLAHIALADFPTAPSSGNDIWGHIDLNTGKEYAIIGLSNAISVVDVSEPENPLIVGSVNGQTTSWRDIKVWQFFNNTANRWQAYAYATADNVSEGLTIINLSGLPQSIELVTRQTLDASAHNVYISQVDYGLNIALSGTEPLLHIAGSNRSNGAFRSYSLLDPTSPGLQYQNPNASRDDYSHDVSSLFVTDSRAQSDCINATETGCNVVLDFNENTLRIWDHTNANQATELSSSVYPLAEYTHSGWWTEDKQYVIVHDELDEQVHGINTTLNIFDISSLKQPLLVGTWRGPTRAIDHNGFVRGNHYYMSNYERGMTVLDISQAASPKQIGYFDTYPVSNNAAFNGAWGVYPFLPSGLILVSDINSGLFVLRDDTQTTNSNSVEFALSQLSLAEGESTQIQVNKSGSGGGSVTYEIINGSASSADRQISQGELIWPANDSSPQTIPLHINVDDITEADEVFFVRLHNPKNGLALAYPNILQVKIKGVSQSGRINFLQAERQVKETDGTVQIQVERTGGTSGQISINYFIQADTAQPGQDVNHVMGSLFWDDGDNSSRPLQITVLDDNQAEQDESFLLVLESSDINLLGPQSTMRITIYDDESNQAPLANAGENFQLNTRQASQLRGMGSDPEGRPLSYLWQQTSGPAVNLSNAASANVNFTAPASAATLTFSFSVTDDFGISAIDNVQVTVIGSTANDAKPSSGGGSLFALLVLAMLILPLRWVRSNT